MRIDGPAARATSTGIAWGSNSIKRSEVTAHGNELFDRSR